MKVLFVGLGAIGQRHLRNLVKLFPDAEILAFRKRRENFVLSNKMEVLEGENLEEKYNIRVFNDLDNALLQKPDIVFITNPTSMHVDAALKAANSACDLFIEKPISHTMEKIEELQQIILERNLHAFVAYQNRFHPCIKKAKEILSSDALGNILATHIEVGEDIRLWHKYEDYRISYAARKELGGGAIVTQIHEIDYACYFFGHPTSVYTIGGNLSHLEVDVEDTANILLSFEKDGRAFPVHIHMDYLQNPPSRGCKIIGSHGRIEFSLINLQIVCYNEKGEITLQESYADFDRNDMFLEELQLFLDIRQGKVKPTLTFDEGMISLAVALAAKKSMEEKTIVRLN